MIAATFALVGLLAVLFGTIKPWRERYIFGVGTQGYPKRTRWDRIIMSVLGTILLICALAVM